MPDLVTRLTPALRLAQAGNAVAAAAVLMSIGAVATLPSEEAGSGAVTTLGCSVLMLVICTLQHVVWQRAMATWRGEGHSDLKRLRLVSWLAHLASYLVLLAGLWAGISGSLAAGSVSTTANLLALALLFLLAAQTLGAVQYLRTAGPSGTVPGHLRRLRQRRHPPG